MYLFRENIRVSTKKAKNTVQILGLILIFSLLSVVKTYASETTTPAQKEQPIIVKYGLYIKKISPDFKEGKFNAQFYWWIKFKNDSTKSRISNDEIMNLEYVNCFDCEVGSIKNEIQEKRDLGNNEYYYTGLHQGTFYFNPDFRAYPFDVQSLNISLESSLFQAEQLKIVPDTNSYISSEQDSKFWALSFDLIQDKNATFNFHQTKISTGLGIYQTDFGDPEFEPKTAYSRITTTVLIDRSFTPYISKLMIPLFIILLLVYYVFFIPADKIDIAAGLTVTSLLSAIAFQLSVVGEMPEIGYIIYMDKIFYSCYFLIAVSMAQSLLTYYLNESEEPYKKRLAIRLDILFRFLFPVLFFSSLILFAL